MDFACSLLFSVSGFAPFQLGALSEDAGICLHQQNDMQNNSRTAILAESHTHTVMRCSGIPCVSYCTGRLA